MYYKDSQEKINHILDTNSRSLVHEELSKKGGNSIIAAVLAILVSFGIMALGIMAEEGMLFLNNSPYIFVQKM